MNVYLAFTVRGNREALNAARALSQVIQRHHHTVITTHLLADDVDAAEDALSEREVFERDMRWLESADLLIAEASGSSYGVGFEVGYVLGRSRETKQRVLLLFDAARRPSISRLIPGAAHARCTVREYADVEGAARIVEDYLRDG